MSFWDTIKTSDDEKKKGNYWDSIALSKNQQKSDDLFDLQGQGIEDQKTADSLNTKTNLAKETVKGVGNNLYDIAGRIALPGATHDELRDKTTLKDTVLGLGDSYSNTLKQVITHPIKTAQSVLGGTARGISDEVTGILTNLFVPKKDQQAKSAQIKETLDKYLNPPEGDISEGFNTAGRAALYIAAGGVLGGLGAGAGGLVGGETGARIGGAVGSASGFVGVGQAAIPTDSTLQQRAEKATQDLVSLGLFELGSKGFEIAKNRIYEGLKAKEIADTPTPKETFFDKITSPDSSKNTTVYSGHPAGAEAPDVTFFTSDKKTAQKYADITSDVTGKSEVTEKDIAGKKLKEVSQKDMQSEVTNPETRKNYDGIKFKVEGDSGESYALFPEEKGISTLEERQKIRDNISQTSQKIADEATKRDLVKDFPELSKIDTMTLKEQTELAREAIAKDKDAAVKQIESTDIPELRKQSIFKELKKQALDEGDVNMIKELAKSNIGTEAGQALKALDDSDYYDADPVKAAKDISESRIKEVEKTEKIDVKKTIKEEKAKFKGPRDWSDFIDSITC